MESIKIRDYTLNDRDRCREILYSIQINNFKWIDQSKIELDDFDHITEGEKIFVACIEHDVIAFASVWEIDFFLHSLYIDQVYQRKGVGKDLIHYLLNYYNHPITLKCVKDNSKALSFYLSLGWVIYREEIGADGPYYLIGSSPE